MLPALYICRLNSLTRSSIQNSKKFRADVELLWRLIFNFYCKFLLDLKMGFDCYCNMNMRSIHLPINFCFPVPAEENLHGMMPPLSCLGWSMALHNSASNSIFHVGLARAASRTCFVSFFAWPVDLCLFSWHPSTKATFVKFITKTMLYTLGHPETSYHRERKNNNFSLKRCHTADRKASD